MKRLLHIFAVVLAVMLLSAACKKEGGRIIPRAKMSQIYAEMLLLDQWTVLHAVNSRQTDTSLVYEPIFNRYGYTTEDYQASVTYYMKTTDRFARIMKSTSDLLAKREHELDALVNLEHRRDSLLMVLSKYRPEKIYWMCGMYDKEAFVENGVKFLVDTAGGEWMFDPCKDIDTLWKGPMLVIPAPFDSAAFIADSLARLDAIAEAAKADSIAKADSVLAAKEKAKAQIRERVKAGNNGSTLSGAKNRPSIARERPSSPRTERPENLKVEEVH